jgi:hypothetical protein
MNKTGIELIAEERREQIEKHGISIKHDRVYNKEYQLTDAATSLINETGPRGMEFAKPKGWDKDVWNKMSRKPYRERLIIAGALIAAELDRLNTEE